MNTTWARRHEASNFYGREKPSLPASKTDLDILIERHRFIRSTSPSSSALSWEDRLAQKAYDQLFKEFALCDLSQYRTGRIALRWRTSAEVIAGKGQFTCGNLKCRHHHDDIEEGKGKGKRKSRELREVTTNFKYTEEGVSKLAEVKLVLCKKCEGKMRYKKDAERREREGKDAPVKEEESVARGKRRREEEEEENGAEDGPLRSRERAGHRETKRRSPSPDSHKRHRDYASSQAHTTDNLPQVDANKRSPRGSPHYSSRHPLPQPNPAPSREDGIYIADGFGPYDKLSMGTAASKDNGPSVRYESLVARWKR